MEPAVDFAAQTGKAREDAPRAGVRQLIHTRGEVRAAPAALAARGEAWLSQAAGLMPEARRRLRGARRRLADFGARAEANVRDAAVVTNRYVQARHRMAVGSAAGLGLALGAMLFRCS